MNKFTKLYKVLIIITFLIVSFFFLRWVNEVRPRWEVREEIIILEAYYSSFDGEDRFRYAGKAPFCTNVISIYDDGGGVRIYNGMQEVINYSDEKQYCYIKELVRIN